VALFSIISGFDAAYAEYNGFQSAIERYWTLKYLEQNHITELDASVLKDGLVRADDLPLVFRALGAESLARGARVRVRVTGTDLLTLDLHASLLTQLDASPAPEQAAVDADLDDTDSAGPLTLAIDIPAEGSEITDPAEVTGSVETTAP
jgi:exoribonuclease-2